MAARMLVICLFLLAKHCVVLVEQPMSSLLKHFHLWTLVDMAAKEIQKLEHERDGNVGEYDGVAELMTSMAGFGANHCKMTSLVCSEPDVLYPLHRSITKAQKLALQGEQTTDERIVVIGARAVKKVTGRKKVLKSTQQYTRAYGDAVRQSHSAWLQKRLPLEELCPSSSDSDEADFCADQCGEAQLEPVLACLRKSLPNVPRVFY